MILLYSLGIILLLLLTAIFFGRFFAWLVEIAAQYFLHLDLKLDTLGLFALSGIEITLKNGIKIEIEKICLHCKWTLSDSKRLFTVLCKGVVVEIKKGNHENKSQVDQVARKRSSKNFVVKHKKTISRLLRKCCQYVGIQVSSVQLIIRNKHGPQTQCFLPDGLHFFARPDNRCLSSTLEIAKIRTKLFNDIENETDFTSDPFAELSCSLLMEISVVPLESFKLESATVNIKNVDILLSEGLLERKSNLQAVNIQEKTKVNPIAAAKPFTLAEIQEKISHMPKSIELAVEVTKITFLNKEKSSLTLEVKQIVSCLNSQGRPSNNSQDPPQCDLKVHVSGMAIKNMKCFRLFELQRLRIESKLSCHYDTIVLASTLYIESVGYAHVQEDFTYWLEYFKSWRKDLSISDTSGQRSLKEGPKRGILSSLPAELEITGSVEVADCFSRMFIANPRPNDQPLCHAVLVSLKLNVKMSSEDIKQFNSGRYLSCRVRVENAYLFLDTSHSQLTDVPTSGVVSNTSKDSFSIPPSTSKHVWGRVLTLGSCNMNCTTELFADTEEPDVKLTIKATSVVIEWSHDVCRFLLKWLPVWALKKFKSAETSSEEKNDVGSSFALDMDCRVAGINLFYLGPLEGGVDSFMTRVDVAVVTTTSVPDQSLKSELCGMKLCRLLELQKAPYRCVVSSELKNDVISIPVLTLSRPAYKPYSMTVEEILVNWDPTLHMALHERIQEATQDGADLQAMMKKTSQSTRADNDFSSKGEEKPLCFACEISWFELHMQTSPKTSFGVEFKNCILSLQDNCFDAKSQYAGLLFDKRSIFKFEAISLKRLPEVEEVLKVRRQFKTLETPSNTTWVFEVETTGIFFPFEFNFAASRDELVNVFKMLQSLHKKPKDASYSEPLPTDLWLRFQNMSFEVEDDPFEVKLRDNYALLLDEMEQWEERQQLLEAKLDEIRKKPGNSLTVKKEEALKRSLEEKNSQIYIERSKAMYNETPMRTSLLTWEFQDLDLFVLADDSYHGQKAVDVMKRLDSDSPYPHSGLEFTTLWCRTVQGKLYSHECRLRDFPQAVFTSESVEMKGTLLGAEQKPANRSKREAVVQVGKPWSNVTISRNLSSLKYFYDLKFDMDAMEIAWGVDIEPVIGMVSAAFEKLSSPSRDPSKNLPFFDKVRLLYHGRLQMAINEWYWYFSASRNPYDVTERMQWEWRQASFDWTNGRIVIEGDFDLHTRAASKYDDRRVIHLPAFKICTNMKWICQGDPNDHHSVIQCAPDKIPELAPNQVHDSYAKFRSQNLIVDILMETGMSKRKDLSLSDPPTVFMFASTFRWFQKYQAVVFTYVSRPIRRGTFFKRNRVKKRSLGRHYRHVSLSLQFPELTVWYWGSFTQQRGFELSLGGGLLETTYRLTLKQYSDGLLRRPAADWSATKLRSEVSNVTCHLYGLEEVDGKEESVDEYAEVSSIDLEPTKYYLLAAARLEYTRQDNSKKQEMGVDGPSPDLRNYNHRLVCHDLKGVWTLTNRRIAFGLFEAYTNTQVLKKNLSADALKFAIVEKKEKNKQDDTKTGSPLNSSVKARSASYTNMLEKLVMEKELKFVAFAEEGTGEHEYVTEAHLHGMALCTVNDVIEDRWHIGLVNSQVVLKGIESEGCVLVAAGNARILNRLHIPVWSKGEIFNKNTWFGNVENLQYFATVGADDMIGLDSCPWLRTSVITGRLDKNSFDIADLANIVGSGEAVGGMVNATGAGPGHEATQLQRIVARCSCEFYFASFSSDLDPVAEEHAANIEPPSPSSSRLREDSAAVNTFTIRHKLLEISTNSAQYAMLIDIVHNAVLYTEPKKKQAIDRLQRMRFHLRLSTSEDQRAQILRLQNTVRSNYTEMRRLERELYEVNLLRKQAIDDQELTDAVIELERTIEKQKELLSSSSSELRIRIREEKCDVKLPWDQDFWITTIFLDKDDHLHRTMEENAYKDFLMNVNTPTPEKAPTAEVTKLAEVYFNHASWQLTQEDGQLAIADVTFTNFSYRKTTLSGATMEHRLELGKFHVRNLLPNSIYKDALSPLDVSAKGHVDRAIAVRLFSRVRPPVGGIGVKEHFEVNVCPLAVRLTHRLFKKVMVFFFPQRAHEYEGEVGEVELGFRGMEVEDKELFTYEDEDLLSPTGKTVSLKRSPSSLSTASSKSGVTVTDSPPSSPANKEKPAKKKSTFYKRISDYDDLDKMKERASKNNTFIYVKIPEVSLLVSYKGEKDRNIIDVHNFSLVIPTLEYHNRTWTWHDLLMAMKKDCVNVLVSQAIKEKLHLAGGHGTETKESKSQAKEEDKARMLLGGFQPKDQQKKSKKKIFSKLAKVARGSKRKGLLQPDGAGPEPVDLEEDQDFEEFATLESDARPGEEEDDSDNSDAT